MIPHEYITQLVQNSDIVDVVQSYVQLRHKGRTYMGLCPFHNEKTPSFVVYPETQSFYCFGCGAGGEVITFIKRITNVEYVEAVKTLAQRLGMPLPNEDDKAGKHRLRLLSVNKDAARFFYKCMNGDSQNARKIRAYWRNRHLSDATIRKFGLGYAPDSFSDTSNYLKKLGYTEKELIDAGIMRRNDNGNTYDFFRHRAMIPIFDVRGNVIAFSGRKIDEDKPGGKYINSPETILYKKSKTLFALNIAKKSANHKYILCEGNMDAIALHQAGFTTAVAGCGTSLTHEHVRILSDYANEVVICFDSDEAGQKATTKAINLFANSPVKVSVLNVQNAKDPDEYIAKFGKEKFEMLLNGSDNAIEYTMLKARQKYDIAQDDGRVAYLKEASNILAGAISPIERDVYAGRLSEETNVSKQSVLTQINSAVKTKIRREKKQKEKNLLNEGMSVNISNLKYGENEKSLGVVFAEQQLMGAILKNPHYLRLVSEKIMPDEFISTEMAAAYNAILQSEASHVDFALLSEELPENIISLLSKILAQNYDVEIDERDINLYIQRIQQNSLQSEMKGDKSVDELAKYVDLLKDKKT